MSVLNPVIDRLDLATKRIYLLAGCRAYHPVDDLYREIRNIRRLDESKRIFDIPIKAFGAVPKGGGKFTPRYAVFYDGWKVVPEDISHSLYISGEQLTEEGTSGPDCLDLTVLSLGTNVIVHYEPPAAELVRDEASLAAINRMQFNEVVTVDVVNGHAGTRNPIGSPNYPSNNIPDARIIANRYGFTEFSIKGDITFDTGDDISYMKIAGENAIRSMFTIKEGADTTGVEIREATVTGTLNGSTIIRACYVFDLLYVSGFLFESTLAGTIHINGAMPAFIMSCYSDTNSVIIDMNGAGHALNLCNWSGELRLVNKIGSDVCRIGINSGGVVIDASVTNGAGLRIGGLGMIVNESTIEPEMSLMVSPGSVAAEVLIAAKEAPIHSDTKKINAANVFGDGSEANMWRGSGV